MNILLQIWGGSFYLGNKIFLAFSEGRGSDHAFKRWGWFSYLIGLPAWVIIFILERNWIMAAIELGSAPSMIFGLLVALHGRERAQTSIFASLSVWFSYALIPFGVGYSLYDYGGLASLTQVLEICAVVGFLGGTYFLAKGVRTGWLLFMVMNIGVAVLMFVQNNFIMGAQQLVSLAFVVLGYMRSRNQLPVN